MADAVGPDSVPHHIACQRCSWQSRPFCGVEPPYAHQLAAVLHVQTAHSEVYRALKEDQS